MAAYKDEARGTWYVSFHYNDWTGKNKRKLKRGFRTRREALEYEQKFLLQQATNLDMRFADFYKLYEEDLKPKGTYLKLPQEGQVYMAPPKEGSPQLIIFSTFSMTESRGC